MAESYPVLETTLIEKLKDLLPQDQLVGGSWKSAYERDLRVLHFKNGSKFFFMTYQTDVSAMGGASIHRVHFDEEPPIQVFNECRLRVMAKGGDLLFTMTPVEGLTWTYKALWQSRGDETSKHVWNSPDLDVVMVDMDDNPTLTERAKEIALAGMSAEERAARKEGKFVALHGLIYGEFDKERHIIETPPVPERERIAVRTKANGPAEHTPNVIVGIDPGVRHPAAVVWAFADYRLEEGPNGEWRRVEDVLEVFHELRVENWTVRQVCEEIHRVNALYGVAPYMYVIDPAAQNRMHNTGRSLQQEYVDNGIVAVPGQNKVAAGINRVRERFQKGTLHVWDSCPDLIEELEQYRWKAPPRTGENTKEAPVKLADDLVDALRYLVMSRPYTQDPVIPTDETPLQRLMREDQQRYAHKTEHNIGQFNGIAN